MSLQIVAFAVVAVIAVIYLYFLDQARVALSARHRDIWRGLRPDKLFMVNRISTFIWHRRDRPLGDPELSRTTAIAFWLGYLTLAAWLAYAALLFWSLSGR